MKTRSAIERLAFLFLEQVWMPLNIILAHLALLFFLLDVRSLLTDYHGDSLKSMAGFFVMGAVMTVRFGRSILPDHPQAETLRVRQGSYMLTLGVVTWVALLFKDWEGGQMAEGASTSLTLIVAWIWWLAASITSVLSHHEPLPGQREHIDWRQLNRVREALWRRQMGLPPPPVHEPKDQPLGLDKYRSFRILRGAWAYFSGDLSEEQQRNPERQVMMLMLPGLLAFALGESIILRAHPEVSLQAMLYVLVYIFGTGNMLACAGALRDHRLIRRRGGRSLVFILPTRVLAGAALVLLSMLLALGTPGMNFEGVNELTLSSGQTGGGEELEGQEQGEEPPQESEDGGGPSPQELAQLLAQLAALGGKILPWVGGALALFLLVQLGLSSSQWGPLVWKRLRIWLGFGWMRRGRSAEARPAPFRWPGMESLSGLPPAETLRQSYRLFLMACAAAGMERPSHLTALEHTRRLPAELRPLRKPLQELVDLYYRSEYAGVPPGSAEQRRCLELLEEIRGVLSRV